MKNIEFIYRELLYRILEKKERRFTQSELSQNLGISLSIVNNAIKKLSDIGAVKILPRSFHVLDIKKALYFWASLRNLKKDIVFSLRVDLPVREMERIMPSGVIYTAYSAYKFRFKDVPADYSEVYVYANEKEIENIQKRLSLKKNKKNLRPNLFVLKKDSFIEKYKDIPLAQIFVDLWNLNEWYAKDFFNAIEKKILEEI